MARVTAVLLGTLLAAAAVAQAGPVTTADAKYHGELILTPAGGTMDASKKGTGNGTLSIRNWEFKPGKDTGGIASDGIYPDQEPIVVAIKDDTFTLDAGALRANRKGNAFTYHWYYRKPPQKLPRQIRMLRLVRYTVPGEPTPRWKLRLVLAGVDLSILKLETPDCRPMALIVGDDDGFGGVLLARPNLAWVNPAKVTIPAPTPAPCEAEVTGQWVWVNQ